jgi:hypothetical protein
MIFTLAKVLRLKKLRQADDIHATLSGLSSPLERFMEIFVRLRSTGHLNQTDPEFFRRHAFDLRDQYSIRTTASGSSLLVCS